MCRACDNETIEEKYTRLRPLIQQGDQILVHGKKALARAIQKGDSDAYFNHIGVVGNIAGSLFIIDSNSNGIEPARLSKRILSYEGGDFLILRSKKTTTEITKALSNILKLPDNTNVKYDFWNGFKEWLNRFTGSHLKIGRPKNRMICSMFTLPMALELDMVYPFEDKTKLFFPQDYLRRIKKENVIIIE